MMKRFLRDDAVFSLTNDDVDENLILMKHVLLKSRSFPYENQACWMMNEVISFSRKLFRFTLGPESYSCLRKMYAKLYPNDFANLIVPESCWKSTEVFIGNTILGSETSRSFKSSYVMAFWPSNNGDIQKFDQMYLTPVPGQIKYFVKHNIFLEDVAYTHTLAYVEWYQKAPDNLQSIYRKPVEVWYKHLSLPTGASSFVPVQRIFSKFICFNTNISGQDFLALVPRRQISLGL